MKRAFTFIELILCLGIIAVLIGILLPAIQSSRRSARDTVCKNNLRQIGIALEQIRGPSPKLRDWNTPPNMAGGWSVAVLPFISPTNADRIYVGMPLTDFSDELKLRPSALTCPLAPDQKTNSGFDRAHYNLTTLQHRRDWFVSDVSLGHAAAWVNAGEADLPTSMIGPHIDGGFFRRWRNGQLNFSSSSNFITVNSYAVHVDPNARAELHSEERFAWLVDLYRFRVTSL